ncbi:hypothetical protein IJ076_03010 [Candidatus Saccharibacteria bacterium]|nr:hypothetical protein [Candidatus Saccharibacteria bacterium]
MSYMANCSFNVEEELESVREEYATAVKKAELYGTEVGRIITEERLRAMQSSLYSVIIALEQPITEEMVKQSDQAVVLYNAISSVIGELNFNKKTAASGY